MTSLLYFFHLAESVSIASFGLCALRKMCEPLRTSCFSPPLQLPVLFLNLQGEVAIVTQRQYILPVCFLWLAGAYLTAYLPLFFFLYSLLIFFTLSRDYRTPIIIARRYLWIHSSCSVYLLRKKTFSKPCFQCESFVMCFWFNKFNLSRPTAWEVTRWLGALEVNAM